MRLPGIRLQVQVHRGVQAVQAVRAAQVAQAVQAVAEAVQIKS